MALAMNAAQAMPGGGTLTFAALPRQRPGCCST